MHLFSWRGDKKGFDMILQGTDGRWHGNWQKVGLRRSLFFAAAPNANSTLHTTLFGTSEFATVAHRTAISLSYREVLVFAVFAKEERNYASDCQLIIVFSRKSRLVIPIL